MNLSENENHICNLRNSRTVLLSGEASEMNETINSVLTAAIFDVTSLMIQNGRLANAFRREKYTPRSRQMKSLTNASTLLLYSFFLQYHITVSYLEFFFFFLWEIRPMNYTISGSISG